MENTFLNVYSYGGICLGLVRCAEGFVFCQKGLPKSGESYELNMPPTLSAEPQTQTTAATALI